MSYLTISRGLGDVATIKFNTQPTDDWTCDDWVTWHKALVQAFVEGRFKSGIKYSRDKAIDLANQVFRQWWDEIVSAWSYNKSWCSYEGNFYAYLKSVGMDDLISLFAEIVNNGTQVIRTTANATSKTVENVAETVENVTGTAKWLLPVGIVVGVGAAGYLAYKLLPVYLGLKLKKKN